ncbi:MAG: hypothetical protein WCS37_03320 [Chloroflexota bacterium]|nr:hypothetical protein [Chloroflexota bacterium]
MDRLTRLMGKTSLSYLLVGFILGAFLMISEGMGANWGYAWRNAHAHLLFVGWFVQFALGIAYWLLPRRKTPERPLGYKELPAFIAWGMINTGILMRVVIEPLYLLGTFKGTWVAVALGISGLLQVGAALTWVSQLWGRFFLRYTASTRPAPKTPES